MKAVEIATVKWVCFGVLLISEECKCTMLCR